MLNKLKIQKLFSVSHSDNYKDWFFYIDFKGYVYLEETEPKIFPNSLKDHRFLKSFFNNLTKNKLNRHPQYSYVSKCWDEFNFVRTHGPDYSPIIFHDFQTDNSESNLIYSQDLKIPFKPEEIGITKEGYLFQKIQLNDLDYGLFSSELSVKLYEKFKVLFYFSKNKAK